MSRLHRVLSGAALTVVVGAGSMAFAPSADAATSKLPSNCTYDKDGNGWVCVTVKTKAGKYHETWRRVIVNNTSRTVGYSCKATETHKIGWSINVTSSVEAGVIFAKADLSVSASLTHEVTTGYETAVTGTLPAHKSLLCQDGTQEYSFTGSYTHTRCGSSACTNSTHTFSMKAPTSAALKVSDL